MLHIQPRKIVVVGAFVVVFCVRVTWITVKVQASHISNGHIHKENPKRKREEERKKNCHCDWSHNEICVYNLIAILFGGDFFFELKLRTDQTHASRSSEIVCECSADYSGISSSISLFLFSITRRRRGRKHKIKKHDYSFYHDHTHTIFQTFIFLSCSAFYSIYFFFYRITYFSSMVLLHVCVWICVRFRRLVKQS